MNDFIAGMIGGLSGLVVGYPFDTIKALMQTREGHSSIIKSTSLIIAQTKVDKFFLFYSINFHPKTMLENRKKLHMTEMHFIH